MARLMAARTSGENIEVALFLIGEGIPVFPCRQDKTPHTRRGFLDASTSRAQIRKWWAQWPDALVGMPTGQTSGIVVLDSDVRPEYDGNDALHQLRHKYGQWPDTPVTLTPGGGMHYAFKWPGFEVRNSASKVGQGLDIRGDGGYVIAAGSRLADGRSYELEASSPEALAEMPAWLLRLIGGSPGPQKPQEATKADEVPQGRRNEYLASYCGTLAHAGLSVEQVRVAVQAENERACSPPLAVQELERTVIRSTATKWVRTGEAVQEVGSLPAPPTWAEFCDLQIPPLIPILGPFTSQQLALIHARTGVGKTMLALALARAMAAGEAFLGWQSHVRASVLYVDAEMPGAMMQDRVRASRGVEGLHMANLTYWASQAGYGPINLADPEGQAIISHWGDTVGADVLILDNLMSLAFSPGVSLNSDEYWAPILPWMVKQRGEGRLVILLDHSNTSGSVHGTKTKTWHVDLALSLSETQEDEPETGFQGRKSEKNLLTSFEKVRSPIPDENGHIYQDKILTLSEVGKEWRWSPGRDALRLKASEMKENGMNYKDIAHATGVPLSSLYRWFPKRKGSDG